MTLAFTDRAKEAIKPLIGELRRFYEASNRFVSDSELAAEITKRYDLEIVDKVCKPLGLEWGGCLVLAVAAAKGQLD